MTPSDQQSSRASTTRATDFAPGRGGLFSPADLRRLLAGEIDRARRQRYALGCIRIGVDRLENLADFYGRDARDEIGRNLQAFLERSLRDCDFLAPLADGGALAVVPHVGHEGLSSMTRRIRAGARQLEFRSGRKTVHVTLSVGTAYAGPGDRDSLDGLLAGATRAYVRALESGGDRSVEWDPQSELQAQELEVRRRSKELEAAKEAAHEVAREVSQARAQAPEEQAPTRVELDPTMLLGAVRQALQEHASAMQGVQAQPTGPTSAEDARQVDQLERRVSKLARELEGYQDQLLNLLDSGGAGPEGVRSIGKMGSADSGAGTLKAAMMSDIFRANLQLREALEETARVTERLSPPSALSEPGRPREDSEPEA